MDSLLIASNLPRHERKGGPGPSIFLRHFVSDINTSARNTTCLSFQKGCAICHFSYNPSEKKNDTWQVDLGGLFRSCYTKTAAGN